VTIRIEEIRARAPPSSTSTWEPEGRRASRSTSRQVLHARRRDRRHGPRVRRRGQSAARRVVTATLAGAPLVVTRGEPIAFRGRVPSGCRRRARARADVGACTRAGQGASPHPPGHRHGAPDRRWPAGDRRARGPRRIRQPRPGRHLRGADHRRPRRTADARSAHVPRLGRRGSGVSTARLVVRADGRILADARVSFEPPAHAFVVGVWANGGWVDNLGALASPRFGAARLRRGLGGIELAALVGAEGLVFRDTTHVTIDGSLQSATRSVEGVGFPIVVRGRIACHAGSVPRWARVSSDAREGGARAGCAGGGRARRDSDRRAAQLLGDVRLGPGRLVLGAATVVGHCRECGRRPDRRGCVVADTNGGSPTSAGERYHRARGTVRALARVAGALRRRGRTS